MKTFIFEENMGEKKRNFKRFYSSKRKEKSKMRRTKRSSNHSVLWNRNLEGIVVFFYSNYEKNVIFHKGVPL